MGREILFKAKWLDNGDWVEGDLIRETNTSGEKLTQIFVDDCNGYWSKYGVDTSTVCQYTGITDEDSTKIWEKDICEVAAEEGRFLVEWDDETARFVLNGDGVTIDFDNIGGQECVVVGNYFDNPELLELEGE